MNDSLCKECHLQGTWRDDLCPACFYGENVGTACSPGDCEYPCCENNPKSKETRMRPDDYQRLAMRTEADQKVILDRLTLETDYYVRAMRLMNAVIGLADDCGEISGCIKRHVEYGQKLDAVNLMEEVGDVLWRLAQICQGAGFTIEQAMEANIAKLQKRYPEKYSDFNAAEENRPRDSERQAVESVHGQ